MISRPELKPEFERHAHYLSGYLLAYDTFDVIDIIPQNSRAAAIIMRNKRPRSVKPWCVQYYGNGHYFGTRQELDNYCHRHRFF